MSRKDEQGRVSSSRLASIQRRSTAVGAKKETPPEDAAAKAKKPGTDMAAEPPASKPLATSAQVEALRENLITYIRRRFTTAEARRLPRRELAYEAEKALIALLAQSPFRLDASAERDMVSKLLNDFLAESEKPDAPKAPDVGAGAEMTNLKNAMAELDSLTSEDEEDGKKRGRALTGIETAKMRIQPIIMTRIDPTAAARLSRDDLATQIGEISGEILAEEKIQLNKAERRDMVTMLLNDMLGLGPLESLLSDEAITDIMVNGAKQIYVERKGKLELTDVQFRDEAHLMNIATRIVSAIGRRVDESSPLCDARLADGSRVNIIIPPLAIDGCSISIRKFSKKKITLDVMQSQGNISQQMATVLKIAARSRLNILISGGTGSGKTTLLNALSQLIDPGERIVTIEDAAELQLQQPHVVRLETRPPNLEGEGEINMRDLVKNSLRMRPDRIILGEVRGAEAVDMLQAMNTGHDGSLGTIHANRPREGLTRLENMVGLAGINLPPRAVRTQIADALDMVIQVSRMRDGKRRITSVTEIVGMEGEVVTTQELFSFQFEGENADGTLRGKHVSSGLRPHFMEKAEYYGLDKPLMEAMG